MGSSVVVAILPPPLVSRAITLKPIDGRVLCSTIVKATVIYLLAANSSTIIHNVVDSISTIHSVHRYIVIAPPRITGSSLIGWDLPPSFSAVLLLLWP